jgi:hypothetical protein
MRTGHERKEAICWVLRRGLVLDTRDNEEIMFSARFLSKICGLPLWMVFYYTRELIREGTVSCIVTPRGEHVYQISASNR